MVKMGSRSRSKSLSRSRSKSPREHVDRFGRTVPARPQTGTRSRSRSRSRDRRRRTRSPRRSPFRPSYRGRSRSRSPRSSSRSSFFKKVSDRTNIEDPEFLNARIFIGNLPSDRTTKQELENLFQAYGKILGTFFVFIYGVNNNFVTLCIHVFLKCKF